MRPQYKALSYMLQENVNAGIELTASDVGSEFLNGGTAPSWNRCLQYPSRRAAEGRDELA